MKDETLIKGDVNEIKCLLALEERGYCVSIPFDGSCKYDLIADIEGHLIKIQCKSSILYKKDNYNGSIKFECTCSTTNTQKTTRHKYSKEQIDYFMTSFNQYIFMIPVEETTASSKVLRLKEPQGNQIETVNIASDYLIDNVLSSIISETPIKRFIDSYIKSIDIKTGEEKVWSYDELQNNFGPRQIRYIKEVINKVNKTAYNKQWFREEFPTL